jgi:hypothetical protein
MLHDERCVKEESCRQGGLDAADSLPIHRAEVHAERKTDLEKDVLCQDVREGTHDIGVMLDPTKAGLDVIGMGHDVIIGVRDA